VANNHVLQLDLGDAMRMSMLFNVRQSSCITEIHLLDQAQGL
jgi:hypothetical protein